MGGEGGMGGEPAGLSIHLDTTCSGIDNIETVALTGPWWGWDPAGGPEVQDDDGDGIYTMTLNDIPMENMEYKWLINGEYENTLAGDPAMPIGACTPLTNPSGNPPYANRLHVAGSGERTDTWGSCVACGEQFTPAETVTISLDTRCSGLDAVESVRITGRNWGWDAEAGPEATDEDGDGIWTVPSNLRGHHHRIPLDSQRQQEALIGAGADWPPAVRSIVTTKDGQIALPHR